MAHGPKEQEEAIIRNLKVNTGRDLDEWIKILESDAPVEDRERIKWLKERHKLGHFQAVFIVERFENKGKGNYDNISELVKRLFSGKNERFFELYRYIAKNTSKFGCDIKVKPCKTYIPFYRKTQFMILKPKSDELYIGLALPEGFENSRLETSKSMGVPERIRYALPVSGIDELDQEVFDLIRQAYEMN